MAARVFCRQNTPQLTYVVCPCLSAFRFTGAPLRSSSSHRDYHPQFFLSRLRKLHPPTDILSRLRPILGPRYNTLRVMIHGLPQAGPSSPSLLITAEFRFGLCKRTSAFGASTTTFPLSCALSMHGSSPNAQNIKTLGSIAQNLGTKVDSRRGSAGLHNHISRRALNPRPLPPVVGR